MKIKIKSCAKDSYWYKNEIGNEFIVDYPIEDTYRVKVGLSSYCVLKIDCEVL